MQLISSLRAACMGPVELDECDDIVLSEETITSIDVLTSKNQALCKYCTHVSNY